MWPSVVEFLFIVSVLRYRRENHTRSRAVMRKLKRRGRNKRKIEMVGYRPMFFAIEYAFHGRIFDRMKRRIYFEKMEFYEKAVSVSCDSYMGICIEVEKEPHTVCEKWNITSYYPDDAFLINCMANVGALNYIDLLIRNDEYGGIRTRVRDAVERAGANGNLNCLKTYSLLGVDCTPAFIPAIKHGHMDCVVWLENNDHHLTHYCGYPMYIAQHHKQMSDYLELVGYSSCEDDQYCVLDSKGNWPDEYRIDIEDRIRNSFRSSFPNWKTRKRNITMRYFIEKFCEKN